jgi:hypothetical protein
MLRSAATPYTERDDRMKENTLEPLSRIIHHNLQPFRNSVRRMPQKQAAIMATR